jgi:hypothetical protein
MSGYKKNRRKEEQKNTGKKAVVQRVDTTTYCEHASHLLSIVAVSSGGASLDTVDLKGGAVSGQVGSLQSHGWLCEKETRE